MRKPIEKSDVLSILFHPADNLCYIVFVFNHFGEVKCLNLFEFNKSYYIHYGEKK